MLQFIRSQVTSIFVKILFVLLIVSFAIWGIGDVFFGSPAGKVAVQVGDDVRFTTQEVAEEFETARRRIGVPLTAEQAIQLGFLDQVIENLVTEGLMTAAVRTLDLSVGTDRAAEFVRSRFADQSGRLDRARYQTYLADNGWTEEEFLLRLRQDFARRQLVDALTAIDAVPAPVVDRLLAYREERRVAEVVAIPAAAVAEPDAPDGATLDSYFDANKVRYEKPEYRTLTWVQIAPATIAATIEVPEDEVRAAYDERVDQFAVPERREVQQILFEAEEPARAAHARIVAGEDFAAVALDATGADEAALDLGVLRRGDLPEGTADAVFTAGQGEVTPPVESPFGWHVFRVGAIQPGTTTSFDDARQRIRDEIAQDRALDRVYEGANALEDALAGGATLEEAARTMDLPLQTVSGIARSGATKAGDDAEGLPGGRFLQIAFETAQGQLSALGEGNNGGFFILRVDGVEAPRTAPIDEVRDQVLTDWRNERRLEIAEERADALAEKARSGTSLADLAAAEGMPSAVLPAITRSGRDLTEGLPGALPAILFGIGEVGGVAVASDDTQAVVVRLLRIEPVDTAAQDQVRASIQEQIAQGTETDVIELLIADLRGRFGVEVNRDDVVRLYEMAQ